VAARVIGKEAGNWFSTFTIDKGSKDGIEVDMNVIAEGGLAGIVTTVGYNYSTVRAVIDDKSYVSAKFLSTSDLCIVEGDLQLLQDGLIRISNINKDAEVVSGDMVVTSYISDKFLPEIAIGYVESVEENPESLTKSGYLITAVYFDSLEEVFVIKALK
jgi:rod shape-determining protein MreC